MGVIFQGLILQYHDPFLGGIVTSSEFKNRPPDSSQPVRIFTLGQFAIMIGDSPLGPRGMSRRRPLELLKGLIALEGRKAHAIQLAESIWPDCTGRT